jgi:aminoglycoside phosphotransferase (APT) family kinase protein
MPADPGRRGAAFEAEPNWALDLPASARDLDVIVWGRLPDAASSPARALRAALARERSLRRLAGRLPSGFRVGTVHRLPAALLATGLRRGIRSAIRAGALVELQSGPPVRRVLDVVVEAAGARLSGPELAFGSGGTLVARIATGADAGLLRVARSGTPGDPARLATTLELLERLGVALAPRPLGHGLEAGASWTSETLLPGRRPPGSSPALARQVAIALASFPRSGGSPTALDEDLRGIAARLPRHADRLARLAERVAVETAELVGILRHGDLWAGNVLVEDGKLTGFVDWDAAHPAGLPGSDLLQLVAVDLRGRDRLALGEAFLARPWDSTEFRVAAADYWLASGIVPTPRAIELAGLAWWAAEVHGTLARLPHRATDERWLASNVGAVLTTLDV